MPDGIQPRPRFGAPGGATTTVPLPTPPVRQFSFTDFSTNNPTSQQPGNNMDAEYDRSNNATTQLINFCEVTFNTDGTLQPGSVGEAQLDPTIVADITADVEAEVQPLVDQANAYASSSANSATAAASSAAAAAGQNTAAQNAASLAVAAANSASQDADDATAAANEVGPYVTEAQDAANSATQSENLCTDYGVVCAAWAEHMPDTIPPNILAVMGITGDHWSARWWANKAALNAVPSTVIVSDTPPVGNLPQGQLWWNSIKGNLYIWYEDPNSSAWISAALVNGCIVTVGSTPPSYPPVGTLFWDNTSGILYIYYQDVDGYQWVAISQGSTGGTTVNPRNLTAAVSGGNLTIPNNITWQQFTQTATIASYTLTMPTAPGDSQDVQIASRGAITSFRLLANAGQALDSPPTTLLAGVAVWFRWVVPLNTWVRLV